MYYFLCLIWKVSHHALNHRARALKTSIFTTSALAIDPGGLYLIALSLFARAQNIASDTIIAVKQMEEFKELPTVKEAIEAVENLFELDYEAVTSSLIVKSLGSEIEALDTKLTAKIDANTNIRARAHRSYLKQSTKLSTLMRLRKVSLFYDFRSHARASIAIQTKHEGLKKWFLLQCRKKSSTLRVGPKGEKPSPRIVYREGKQDGQIAEFHEWRKYIKNIIARAVKYVRR